MKKPDAGPLLRGRSAMSCLLMAVCLSLTALAPIGCRRAPVQEPDVRTVAYTVRGVVAQTPSPDSPAAEFVVHHEPIPSFRATWPDGSLGMKSMTMPFPPSAELTLEGVQVGQIIELTFEVDYDTKTGQVKGHRATRVVSLPASTELHFESTSDTPSD